MNGKLKGNPFCLYSHFGAAYTAADNQICHSVVVFVLFYSLFEKKRNTQPKIVFLLFMQAKIYGVHDCEVHTNRYHTLCIMQKKAAYFIWDAIAECMDQTWQIDYVAVIKLSHRLTSFIAYSCKLSFDNRPIYTEIEWSETKKWQQHCTILRPTKSVWLLSEGESFKMDLGHSGCKWASFEWRSLKSDDSMTLSTQFQRQLRPPQN